MMKVKRIGFMQNLREGDEEGSEGEEEGDIDEGKDGDTDENGVGGK